MMKPIPEFPGYFADELGNIYSKRPWGSKGTKPPTIPRLLKKSNDGRYWHVVLMRDGKTVTRNVAPLILSAFVSQRPQGQQVCHGVKGSMNDSLDNLCWGTTQKNHGDDKLRDGTLMRGQRNCNVKLNELQVRIIRRSHNLQHGISCRYLASIFHVSRYTIFDVIRRRSWNYI